LQGQERAVRIDALFLPIKPDCLSGFINQQIELMKFHLDV
jgi:hypothetical protein